MIAELALTVRCSTAQVNFFLFQTKSIVDGNGFNNQTDALLNGRSFREEEKGPSAV